MNCQNCTGEDCACCENWLEERVDIFPDEDEREYEFSDYEADTPLGQQYGDGEDYS